MACARAEKILNTAIAHAPQRESVFEDIAGKSIHVTTHLPSCDFIVQCRDTDIALYPGPFPVSEIAADVQLSGSTPALVFFALEQQSITLADAVDNHDGPVKISGDQEFLSTLRKRLQHLDIDWEALTASLLGDIPAHLLAESVRKGKAWQDQTISRSADSMENYFRHEWASSPLQRAASQISDTLIELGGDRKQLQTRLDALKSRFLQIIG